MGHDRSAQRAYDRLAPVYDRLADRSESAARAAGIELLAPRPGERVLELGFGTGHALAALAPSVGAEGGSRVGSVHGIDISWGMIRQASRRLGIPRRATGGRVHLVQADTTRLPYAGATFDAAFASFAIELLEPEAVVPALIGIHRVLRPGGRFGLVSMFDDGCHHAMVDLYRFLHRHFPHVVDCRPIAAPELLVRAGFRITAREHLTIWGLPVAVLLASRP